MGEEIWTKEYKIERYRKMNETAEKGSVLFAGSSLMEMFPVEKFSEKLPVTVYNRGVGGFVTEELMDNLDVCILDLEPRKLFINIGTNDLSDASKSVEKVMENYAAILTRVREALPDVKLYIMAYYPVNYDAAAPEMKECLRIRSNERIDQANRQLLPLAVRFDGKYINVNSPLMDKQQRLKAEYTIEGMHINEDGYRAIYPLVKKFILE